MSRATTIGSCASNVYSQPNNSSTTMTTTTKPSTPLGA